MPPPPPPPAPGAHQQPCAHRPQPAAHCGAHAPRPQAGSAPWLPAAPSQLMLQQSAAVGGAPALYGVASFGPQQRQQSLPPRMQVGPAMAPVHAPHGAAPSPPRHHTTSYVSREQFMQLQLLSAVAARQQAAFRGVPSANR
ncbi:hypothetical protein HXX76_013712 [Chlamydomonas incerta]|uniref:Uncharacterized protein n=1 Tax=Chlamydomonas incerta TaxID=51695 RepID=A0A835VTQ0_CHLIN|nr:hypothetical protein HXX76_013712 [Chlamydomonas incerta]|eukprot:KAG2425503.1 hypothetical protein HXX76_013712 [Chlamydomonas incerta]